MVEEQKSEQTSSKSGQSTKFCVYVANLCRQEKKVILRHIDEHKWFEHIPTEKFDWAVRSFNDKYGWLQREMFCRNACPYGKINGCEAFSKYLERHGWIVDSAKKNMSMALVIQGLEDEKVLPRCQNLVDFLNKFEPIILVHLNEHKAFNNISNDRAAIYDFVRKFAWAAREVYCDSLCNKNATCSVYQEYLNRFTKVDVD